MKRFLIAAMAVLALAASVVVPAASAGSQKNIVQVAASNPQFSTLVKLVKQAGLVKALSGHTKLTVFAPTNAAFAKVPKATLNKLAHDKKLLAKVLEYHVVPGAVPAAKVVKLTSAKTLEGAKVRFRVSHGKVYVNKAQILKTDIRASNGIVHVLGGVLIPPA